MAALPGWVLLALAGTADAYAMTIPQSASGRCQICVSRPRSAAVRLQETESTSLLTHFNLGLARQRAGDAEGALEAYQFFVDVASSNGAPAHTFAEVLVNMGVLRAQQRDRVAARASFEQALELRPMAAAHVNLALICLADGASTAKEEGVSGSMPVSAVLNAKEHCRAAIE